MYYLLLFACGQSSSKQEKPEHENKVNYSRQETKNSNYLKLNKHEILDREGTGMVAFTCLIPEGWNVKDQLYWEYNDATLPIRYKGLFENPPQNLQINSFPDVRAVYSSGPTGTSGYPPPRGILQGLKELVKKNVEIYNLKLPKKNESINLHLKVNTCKDLLFNQIRKVVSFE